MVFDFFQSELVYYSKLGQSLNLMNRFLIYFLKWSMSKIVFVQIIKEIFLIETYPNDARQKRNKLIFSIAPVGLKLKESFKEIWPNVISPKSGWNNPRIDYAVDDGGKGMWFSVRRTMPLEYKFESDTKLKFKSLIIEADC